MHGRVFAHRHGVHVPATLVADRFLPQGDGRALDIATNVSVWLRVERESDAQGRCEREDRCATLSRLWHPWLADCIDYGPLDAGRRFEAYRIAPARLQVGLPPLEVARAAVAHLLRAAGVEPGALALERTPQGVLVVPGGSGSRTPHESDPGVPPRVATGLSIAPGAVGVIEQHLRDQPRPGVTHLPIAVPRGGGGSVLLRAAARVARLLGWLPMAAGTFAASLRVTARDAKTPLSLLEDRHVVLLHDARHAAPARAASLADLAVRLAAVSTRPCLLLVLVLPDTTDALIRVPPLTAEHLRRAVVGPPLPTGDRRALGAAIDRAGGGAAPLRALLASWARTACRVAGAHGERVHEAHTVYAAHAAPAMPSAAARPAGRAIAALSAARAAARDLARRGRYAAAVRSFTAAAAHWERRGHAGVAGQLLAEGGALLYDRGEVHDAARTLDRACAQLADANLSAPACRASTLLARARLDLLDAERAEALLRTAVTGATVAGLDIERRWAAAGLARVLWWRGRLDEARHLAGCGAAPDERGDADDELDRTDRLLAIVEHGTRVRVHSASGDLAAASADARAAADLGRGHEGTRVALAAAAVHIRWLAALGDRDGLNAMVPSAVAAASQLKQPLVAARLRLCAADGLLRAGHAAAARAFVAPLRRAARAGPWPPLLAARIELAWAGTHGRPALAVRRTLRARGIAADAASRSPVRRAPPSRSVMYDEVLEVLRIGHEHEQPDAALQAIAEWVRTRVGASLVCVRATGDGGAFVSVPAGRRAQCAAADRAVRSRIPLLPAVVNDGIEAGAPAIQMGAVVGALGCRWLAGTPVDENGVMPLLTAAAAAAAPCLVLLSAEPQAVSPPPACLDLLGVSPAMDRVRAAVARASLAPYPALIAGESGVGKELVARAVHRAGPRASRPFCAVNCAALPDELLEAELFGHVRGAFTGAVADRRGLFEEADNGVLFLDEVGELSARGQAKLLRVLQEREVRRVGEAHPRRVDVHVIAATNRVLEREVAAGRFRQDLRYRLDVIRIEVPPLRERAEDIPVLARAFWTRAAQGVGSRAVLSDAAMAALARYDWPGNVRELQNVLAGLAVSAPRRGIVGPGALPDAIARAAAGRSPVTLDEARRRFEQRFVRAALARAGGHRGRAAADLGLTRQGLAKLLERLEVAAMPVIEPQDEGAAQAS